MIKGKDTDENYARAKATLTDSKGNPTPKYSAYMRYESEWNEKRQAHQSAYSEAMGDPLKMSRWGVEGKIFIDAINSAMNKWLALGYKNEIDQALKTLSANQKKE